MVNTHALYSPLQVRTLLSVPPEQFRNWRKHLHKIRREQPGQAAFDFADLLAFAVVQRLVVDFSLPISRLNPIAESLIGACRNLPLEGAAEFHLEFVPAAGRIVVTQAQLGRPQEAMVVLPLGPVVKSLIAGLTTLQETQGSLPLFRE